MTAVCSSVLYRLLKLIYITVPLPYLPTCLDCQPSLVFIFYFFKVNGVHVARVTHKSDPQGKRVFVLHKNWMDWEKSTTCHSFEKVKSLRCFDSVM